MFRVSKLNDNAQLPVRGRVGDAGYDLFACEDAIVDGNTWKGIGTGIAIEIPVDCYARVAPRSGLAAKHGIDVLAGVIDHNYRGEIRVILYNHGSNELNIKAGDRIAQLIFERIYTPDVIHEVPYEELSNTSRGADGFGSSGV